MSIKPWEIAGDLVVIIAKVCGDDNPDSNCSADEISMIRREVHERLLELWSEAVVREIR